MSDGKIKRDDYKAIKRMDREQMSAYLQRIYMRGFKAGQKSKMPKATIEKGAEKPVVESAT